MTPSTDFISIQNNGRRYHCVSPPPCKCPSPTFTPSPIFLKRFYFRAQFSTVKYNGLAYIIGGRANLLDDSSKVRACLTENASLLFFQMSSTLKNCLSLRFGGSIQIR